MATPVSNSPGKLPGTASELVLTSPAVGRLRKAHCRSKRPSLAVASGFCHHEVGAPVHDTAPRMSKESYLDVQVSQTMSDWT